MGNLPMNEKLQEALIDLANKLGTTVEVLWQKLVRFAVIDGLVSVILCVASSGFLATLSVFVMKSGLHSIRKQNRTREDDDMGFGKVLLAATLLIASFLALVIGLLNHLPQVFEPTGYLVSKLLQHQR